ncbi:VirD4-like conjugal transfer protein, CD1115 family [Spiroplasma endosymbiont of Polydrusus formosus]|uniref:VirD4-like conjugal transfer protein, CD1115 family n=1 Tax=Spiroplasma endosymbiont of Polydrusus formosus TaxID=3139326 RepID=UPI0035B54F68
MWNKIKKKKISLLIGLCFVPIIFIFCLTLFGIGYSIFNNWKQMAIFINEIKQFQILSWWNYIIKSEYGLLITVGLSLAFYCWFFYFVLFSKVKSKETAIKTTDKIDFGDSKWLSIKEIDDIGDKVNIKDNYKNTGFVFNCNKNKKDLLFNLKNNIHSVIVGSTASGKTQGIVLPTIYLNGKSTAKQTMIITDPKGELYNLTSGFLEENGYKIKVIDFRNLEKGNTWNPLKIIYDDFIKMMITDNEKEKIKWKIKYQDKIRSLSRMLINKNINIEDEFWNESTSMIVQGIILAILEDYEDKINKFSKKSEIEENLNQELFFNKFNMASVAAIASFKKDLVEWLNNRKNTSIAKITASQALVDSKENRTLDSILITVAKSLEIFNSDFIRNLTSQNDINYNDFIEYPTVLYIIFSDENDNYYKLIAILISQIYQFLTNHASKTIEQKLEKPVYFILDEFANLTKINNFERWVSISRSRNIFFQLILQDINQLKLNYGDTIAKIILNNCGMHIFLHTNDLETIKYYSELFGTKTIEQISINENKSNISVSKNLKSHPLMLTSELANLKQGQGIVKISRYNPMKITLKLWKDLKLSEKTNPFQLKEIEYINFNKEYFYDIKNNKKEMKENETNEFANLTTEEITTNINNLKIQLTEYEKTNYKSIQNKTMINLLLQKIKNLETELIKRQENQ